jgi:hypothetical protein
MFYLLTVRWMYAQSWKPELLLRQSKPASTKVMKPFRATKYFVWPRGGEVRFVQQAVK